MTTQEREAVKELLEAVRQLYEGVPDEVRKEYNERMEMLPDIGNYENATLHGPDGREHPLQLAGYTGHAHADEHGVDVYERDVPPDVDLSRSSVVLRNGTGVVIFEGSVKRVLGPKTLGGVTTINLRVVPAHETS